MPRHPRIALLVRGHERGAFGNRMFAEYAKGLGERLGGAKVAVFVHTWSESEAKQSHRPIRRDDVHPVTEKDVRNYLGNIVEWVGIDDDTKIELVGSVTGRIGGIPARPWKNMWYGKRRAAEALEQSDEDFDLAVCVRVDNFLNMESRRYAMINTESMDKTIRKALDCDDPDKIHFIKEGTCPGIDNFYTGRPHSIINLINRFHYEMDDIRAKYPHIHHQEYMVYYEAANIAGSKKTSPL